MKPDTKPQARGASPESADVRTSPRLSIAELVARMCLANTGLIEEIHSLALRQGQSEDQREGRLDAKAQGLLGTASLSLTFAFGFGGILLNNPEYMSPLGRWRFAAIILYAVALAFGLLAAIWAGRALYVTGDYQAVSDDNVFNAAELDAIERDACDDADIGRALYRRYIAVQHWRIYRKHFDVHERKATLVKTAQNRFFVFLSILLLIAFIMAYAAIKRHVSTER